MSDTRPRPSKPDPLCCTGDPWQEQSPIVDIFPKHWMLSQSLQETLVCNDCLLEGGQVLCLQVLFDLEQQQGEKEQEVPPWRTPASLSWPPSLPA